MLFRLISLIILLTTLSISATENVIKVLGPRSSEDIIQSYYFELLDKALKIEKSKQLELKVAHFKNVTQGRTLQLLNDDSLDVFWTGTSIERERDFYAIKIPLMKGLLGYRVSIIREQDLFNFSTLSTEEFQQKIACQGAHWPDTKILDYNKYTVNPIVHYSAMFKMVSKKRCDYFPRAIFEGYSELAIVQKEFENLVMLDNILLYYPFPIYFFVNKNNIALGKTIERGLEQLIDNGEFDRLMKSHQATRHIFPIEKWQGKRIIQLKNPFLTKETNINNTRYWLPLPSQ